MLLGTVAAVTETCNPETRRVTAMITGEYNLGCDTMRHKTLNIRSVAIYIDVAAPSNSPVAPKNRHEGEPFLTSSEDENR